MGTIRCIANYSMSTPVNILVRRIHCLKQSLKYNMQYHSCKNLLQSAGAFCTASTRVYLSTTFHDLLRPNISHLQIFHRRWPNQKKRKAWTFLLRVPFQMILQQCFQHEHFRPRDCTLRALHKSVSKGAMKSFKPSKRLHFSIWNNYFIADLPTMCSRDLLESSFQQISY